MTPLERVYAEERWVQLAADAIQRRHPNADWIARHGQLYATGLTDAALEAANERLTAWLETNKTPATGLG